MAYAIGTPVKPFDAFKMLHGAEDDDVEKSGEAKARKDDEPGEGEEEEHGEPAAAVAVRDRVVAKPDGAERDKRIVEAYSR